MGFFQQAFFVAGSPGKGASLVAKHLTLQQVLAKSTAVDDDHGIVFAATLCMDGLGKNLFARTGRSRQQDGRVCQGYFQCQVFGLQCSRGLSQNLSKAMLIPYFLLQAFDFVLKLSFLAGFGNQRNDLGLVITFHQVVKSPVFHRLHPVLDIAKSRQADYLRFGRSFLDFCRKRHAMAVRKLYISKHH